jgi:GrpB-like predicted nucleotidyltransferase (UPF0157 family)
LKIEPFNRSPEGVTEPFAIRLPHRHRRHDATWPAQFEREAAAVRDVLGARAFRSITWAPRPYQAWSKPIVDILLVVADSPTPKQPQLEAAGSPSIAGGTSIGCSTGRGADQPARVLRTLSGSIGCWRFAIGCGTTG